MTDVIAESLLFSMTTLMFEIVRATGPPAHQTQRAPLVRGADAMELWDGATRRPKENMPKLS